MASRSWRDESAKMRQGPSFLHARLDTLNHLKRKLAYKRKNSGSARKSLKAASEKAAKVRPGVRRDAAQSDSLFDTSAVGPLESL